MATATVTDKKKAANAATTEKTETSEKNKPQGGVVRVQFDCAQEVADRLDELKKQLGAKSRADVLRYLVPAGEFMLMAKMRNAEIIIREPDGTQWKAVILA